MYDLYVVKEIIRKVKVAKNTAKSANLIFCPELDILSRKNTEISGQYTLVLFSSNYTQNC